MDGPTLLATRPRVFWGKVVWVFIQRGWTPPPPDERITDDLLRAFEGVTRDGRPAPTATGLTARQLEILQLIADGHDNAGVGRLLGIAPQTVKFHMTDILARMDAKNRAHAVANAFRAGLVG